MSLSRRDFVKLCTGTVAGFGISQMFNPAVLHALEKAAPNVLWLQGQGCTGCSVSLLNSVNPKIADVLLKVISLGFHPTVMAGEGEIAFEHLYKVAKENKGKFLLMVEGAVPVAEAGRYCVVGEVRGKEYTMSETTAELGSMAAAVISLGTCAAYGGIPAAKGSATGALGVKKFFDKYGIKTPVVNIPGCPPHPDWMIGSLVYALENGLEATVKILDSDGRPTPFFGKNIHDNCPYLPKFDAGQMCPTFTQKDGCRYDLGCKGPTTSSDCPSRKWNGGVNWCVENAVCIGCVEPDFPDGKSPFYVAG